jgi:hypothetical protein
MHDKAALLAALTSAMSGRPPNESQPPVLDLWHSALRSKYIEQAHVKGTRLAIKNSQFSYAIIKGRDEALPIKDLMKILTEMNKEGIDRVNTGWSMFFPFTRLPISPYIETDPTSGIGEEEFLEANLVLDGHAGLNSDMWRVSQSGLASLIRPIRYDYLDKPGWSDQLFSLNEAARNIAQVVRHAEAMALRFDTAREVAFICEWRGFSGRKIGDPNSNWYIDRVARTDAKISRGTFLIGEIVGDWPTVVSTLLGPIVRAFDPNLDLPADWIRSQSASWRPIGSQWP